MLWGGECFYLDCFFFSNLQWHEKENACETNGVWTGRKKKDGWIKVLPACFPKPMSLFSACVLCVPSPTAWTGLLPSAAPTSAPVCWANCLRSCTSCRRSLARTWEQERPARSAVRLRATAMQTTARRLTASNPSSSSLCPSSTFTASLPLLLLLHLLFSCPLPPSFFLIVFFWICKCMLILPAWLTWEEYVP